jgi:hypothetical protein
MDNYIILKTCISPKTAVEQEIIGPPGIMQENVSSTK